MSERSKAAKVADEHYEVTFDGFNRFKQETFSSEEYWRLENNWKHRDHFIAGYERALKDIEQKSVPDTSALMKAAQAVYENADPHGLERDYVSVPVGDYNALEMALRTHTEGDNHAE